MTNVMLGQTAKKITREEALKRLKATKEAKKRRIIILEKSLREEFKANTGKEPESVFFL